jgi:uncharacterized membrane protein YtjA (UPF0391 family)
MLNWALSFLVLALIAAILGLTGLAGAATNIAWILFVVFLGLWDKTPTGWHKGKVSLRAERSNLCPTTESASSLPAPRNDSLVSSIPLFA